MSPRLGLRHCLHYGHTILVSLRKKGNNKVTPVWCWYSNIRDFVLGGKPYRQGWSTAQTLNDPAMVFERDNCLLLSVYFHSNNIYWTRFSFLNFTVIFPVAAPMLDAGAKMNRKPSLSARIVTKKASLSTNWVTSLGSGMNTPDRTEMVSRVLML